MKNISITNYNSISSELQFVIRHHIYTGVYKIHNNAISILIGRDHIFLSADDSNFIRETLYLSGGAEHDFFLNYYEKHKQSPFSDILRKYKKSMKTIGIRLKENFVKFYYPENPNNILYAKAGRTFINYSEQLSTHKAIHDIPGGCGLSAGYLDKTFLYFFQAENYGDNIMILKPYPFSTYRLQDYEILGPKFRCINYSAFSNPDIILYILSQMSSYAKTTFFQNKSDYNQLNHCFGNVDDVIMKMQALKKYDTAVSILKKEKENWYSPTINPSI